MANIALYPGGYKPPHIGHYEAAKEALGQADKIIVFVGPKEREGITQAMSIQLWELYTQNDPIEIRKAGVSPVRDVYDFVELEAKDGDVLSFIKGEKDSEDPRFARIPSYAEKFGKKITTTVIPIPDIKSRTNKEISGRLMRSYIKDNNKESFIDGLPEDIDEDKAWNLVTGKDWKPGDPVSKEMWDGWSLKIGAGKEYNENLKNRENAVAYYRPEKAEEWAYKRYEYVAPKIKGFGPEIEELFTQKWWKDTLFSEEEPYGDTTAYRDHWKSNDPGPKKPVEPAYKYKRRNFPFRSMYEGLEGDKANKIFVMKSPHTPKGQKWDHIGFILND